MERASFCFKETGDGPLSPLHLEDAFLHSEFHLRCVEMHPQIYRFISAFIAATTRGIVYAIWCGTLDSANTIASFSSGLASP